MSLIDFKILIDLAVPFPFAQRAERSPSVRWRRPKRDRGRQAERTGRLTCDRGGQFEGW